jgi:hypothetical protein
MIDLTASAILSEFGPEPEGLIEIATGTFETMIAAALAFPSARYGNLEIFLLPDGPRVEAVEIGQMAAAYAISPA